MISKIIASTMRNGLIFGVVLAAIFLLSTTSNNLSVILGNVLFIYSVVMVYRLTIRFREVENDGVLKYHHSLAYIATLYLYASIVSGIVVLIYTKFIHPEFLALMMNKPENVQLIEELANAAHVSKNSLRLSLEVLMTPMSYTLQYMWGYTFMGIFIGAIFSFFTKKSVSNNLEQNK